MPGLEVAARAEELDVIQCFLAERLEESGIDSETRTQVELAAEEIFSKIAAYASAAGWEDARVRCQLEDSTVTMACLNDGQLCDLLEFAHVNLAQMLQKRRQERQLTAFLAKDLPDTLEYRYEQGVHILRIRAGARAEK